MYAHQGRDSSKIVYHLHIGNVPGNLDQAAQVGMSGYIEKQSYVDEMQTKESFRRTGIQLWL